MSALEITKKINGAVGCFPPRAKARLNSVYELKLKNTVIAFWQKKSVVLLLFESSNTTEKMPESQQHIKLRVFVGTHLDVRKRLIQAGTSPRNTMNGNSAQQEPLLLQKSITIKSSLLTVRTTNLEFKQSRQELFALIHEKKTKLPFNSSYAQRCSDEENVTQFTK